MLTTLVRGALASRRKRRALGDGAPALPTTRLTQPATAIDPAHVAAYADVCGFPPARGGPLPLTYPHVLAFPLTMRLMADPAFPLPLLGLVHTSIEITRHGPLTGADTPELTVYATELTPHRRGTEVKITTEARLAGTLAWTSHSTYLARHRLPTAPQKAGPAVTAPGPETPTPDRPAPRPTPDRHVLRPETPAPDRPAPRPTPDRHALRPETPAQDRPAPDPGRPTAPPRGGRTAASRPGSGPETRPGATGPEAQVAPRPRSGPGSGAGGLAPRDQGGWVGDPPPRSGGHGGARVAQWRLPAGLGRRYGAVSGDRNPIHLHPLTAKAFGFPRAIAHGMWTVARCLAEADPEGRITHAHAEFKAPVLLPATVTYAAEGRTLQLRSGDRVHLVCHTTTRATRTESTASRS
ncbi:MaoC/PaaZ C-terminal domain-containing protein [Streptomyces sp. SYSU K217416]